MAPVKSKASSAAAKDFSSSFSTPVSLLWAHQLRREHSALLTRIEELTSTVSDVSTVHLDRVSAQSIKAGKKTSRVESELLHVKKDLEQVSQGQHKLDESLHVVSGMLETLETRTQSLQKEVQSIEKPLRDTILASLAKSEKTFSDDRAVQDHKMQDLTAKVDELENRRPAIVNESVVEVRDSIEEMREQMKQIANLKLRPTNPVTSADMLRAPNAVRCSNQSEETELMLTMQPNSGIRISNTPLHDIDLDEGMHAWQSPLDYCREAQDGETLTMLPELTTEVPIRQNNLGALKQGKFQGWDRFVEAGEERLSMSRKRKHGEVIDTFVAGIYDDEQRSLCEKELDAAGWTWANLKKFVKEHTAGESETQARRRTEPLSHKHEKGKVCPVCSKKPVTTKKSEKRLALEQPRRNAVEQVFQPVQIVQIPETLRRSSRIFGQSQNSQPVIDLTNKTTFATQRTTKAHPANASSNDSDTGIPAQTLRPIINRVNVVTTPDNFTSASAQATTMAARDMKIAALQARLQQNDLSPLNKNRNHLSNAEVSVESQTKKKKTVLFQEPGANSSAKPDPVTPINRSIEEVELGLVSQCQNVEGSTAKATESQTSKKRKLVDRLEPVMPQEAVLGTPMDKPINQTGAKEPERKKRRKKGKRAPLPTPMIPILPLTDEDE